jgi:hypothetical protein
MTITLATLFRRYDLQIESGFEMEFLPSFTLRPKNGLPIRVSRRGSNSPVGPGSSTVDEGYGDKKNLAKI